MNATWLKFGENNSIIKDMKIYNTLGYRILDIQVDDNSYQNKAIMGEHSLTLYYSLPEHVEIPVGSYCEFAGVTYTLERPENFKMKHSRLFEYTVVLDPPEAKAKIWKFRNPVDGRLKFSLTAKPIEHLQMFVDNMNRRDKGWSVGDCIDGVETLINYDHTYCLDALKQQAETFKTEYEFKGKRVSLKKVEYNKSFPLPLSYGRGKGFKSGIGRSNTTDQPPVEVLYVQGGTTNIDPSKYGCSELLLPRSKTLYFDGEHFEDEEGFNKENARLYATDADGRSIRRYDKQLSSLAEDSIDCSEIYPKRVGSVSSVVVVDEKNHFYDIVDSSIPSSLNLENCLIEGETMTIEFQSGMLAGREFDVKYCHEEKTVKGVKKAARRFEIVPQDIDGQTMPNATFAPKGGDKYAVFNCMLPDSYVCDNETKSGASWDMFRAAVKYLFENEEQKFTFSGELDGIWAKKDWMNISGRLVLGGFILFSDERFQKEGVRVRIVGIKTYINKPHSPVIELSNSTVTGGVSSTLKELQSQDVTIQENHKAAVQFTKRRFRDAKETITMLEESLLDNFTGSINPIAVQTMSMLVGDESLQFRFVTSKTAPQTVTHSIVWDNTEKQLKADAGIIQHMTIGISSISSEHKVSEYRFWDVERYLSGRIEDEKKRFYLYAKVSKTEQTGVFLLSEKAIKLEQVSGFYHLLVGVLNSEYDGERSFATLYGFTEVLPARVTTDKVVSVDGTTYFDLANSVIGGRIKFRSTNGSDKELSEFENELNDKLNKQEQDYIDAIGGLQQQIDGAIESFFYEYNPTVANFPASSWETVEERNKHLNDTFTNLKTGRSWRWSKSNQSFQWTEITDSAMAEALRQAGQAQDTADSKRRVFVTQPYPPYDIGDLWVQGSTGDIMTCKVSRVTGIYITTDWVRACKYTDDSKFNEFIRGDFADLKANAIRKETIIEGGYLKNDLIDTNNIVVKNIYSKNGNFKTTEDGTVYAKNAVFVGGLFEKVHIQGTLRNPFVQGTDSIVIGKQSTYDNVATVSSGEGGFITAGFLEWDVNQSGRRMCIVNYRWENEFATGAIGYTAPPGKFFYEDGVLKQSIQLSRECVELIGYGTTSVFYGWIVLNRLDIGTTSKYGRKTKALAMGYVTGSNSGASITYKTFDSSKSLSVSRIGVGRYQINFPNDWFNSANDVIAMTTGLGNINKGSYPLKASVGVREKTYIIVDCSDDINRNDGSFMFILYNMNDWFWFG